ncbi:selenium cofactor biosynthesis protein YqeC [Hafnia alvei]|uniref:Probable selenium-dependent hydroxylase accessory protein YqeC n=1 Tax=Hafnia alvei TaxID=569 RepID=A0A1C6Z635_HAFAL|nr:selenium cofactor biosynthesis protein YqeC [Hafnia alvei]NLS55520.1 putative selenium-dependent hydroxylase accessory protein YqeC [Hafnia alvei]SCM54576.1 probable selenium-dependent hydroxylase accessory protein YqeC [Hafnia alvei]
MNSDKDVLFNDVLFSVKNNKSYLISLIGAGGKTSTLFWLAQRFSQQGLSVLITTTTHMFLPEASQAHTIIEKEYWHTLVGLKETSPCASKIVALFTEYNAATHKVSGITTEQADMLQAAQLFDVILVEADGAHQRLLKTPAGHEPCIPQSSRCVIALTGGLVINNPADPEQIHRWPIFADLCDIKAGDRLNISVFERFIAHPDGMFKGSPPQALRVWFINRLYQIDNALLGLLTALLDARPELDTIWIGAVQESPPITHQLCQSHTTQRN